MISDLLIPLNKEKTILLEVELNNSYNKFSLKMKGYYDMLLRLENKQNLSNYFYKNSIILFIFVNNYKLQRYEEIIKESGVLGLDNIRVKLLPLESL